MVAFAVLGEPVALLRAGTFTVILSIGALLLRRPERLEVIGHLLVGVLSSR